MKILISNDDGIESQGIWELAKAVSSLGEVTIVAPHRERSTSGHSLTLHKPLRIFPHDGPVAAFSTTGTPADCIYLGIREILKGKPDLILSGVNAGANLGTDIHYSGTVAASREGALMNVRSYAFSLADVRLERVSHEPMRYEMGAAYAKKVIELTMKATFPPHTLLNVNIPNKDPKEIRGIKVTRQGFRYYANEVTKRQDPRGRDYYWIGGPYIGFEKIEGSDCNALADNYVAVTPITIDCTHENFYKELSKLNP